jgi:hypothetical protein
MPVSTTATVTPRPVAKSTRASPMRSMCHWSAGGRSRRTSPAPRQRLGHLDRGPEEPRDPEASLPGRPTIDPRLGASAVGVKLSEVGRQHGAPASRSSPGVDEIWPGRHKLDSSSEV